MCVVKPTKYTTEFDNNRLLEYRESAHLFWFALMYLPCALVLMSLYIFIFMYVCIYEGESMYLYIHIYIYTSHCL